MPRVTSRLICITPNQPFPTKPSNSNTQRSETLHKKPQKSQTKTAQDRQIFKFLKQ